MHYPLTDNFEINLKKVILRSIGLLDIKLPRKEIISTDNIWTDGLEGIIDFEINRHVGYQITAIRNIQTTYGRTDGQTIGSFFEKRKKTTENKLWKMFVFIVNVLYNGTK